MNNNYENNREAWQEMQRESDKYVFEEEANGKIRHLGFNNISDFDIAIRNVKRDLVNYDILLEKQQDKIDEIDMKLSFKKPEHDKNGSIQKLNETLEKELAYADELIAKKAKEERNLAELEAAKKEFLNNKKMTFREEIKEKKSELIQHENATKELKGLEGKMYAGTMNNFEKERYQVLKDEIIPDLSNDAKTAVDSSEPVVGSESNPVNAEELSKAILGKLNIPEISEEKKAISEEPIILDTSEDGIFRKAVKAISNIPSMFKAKIDNRKALKAVTSSASNDNDGPPRYDADDIYGVLEVPNMSDEEVLAKMNIRK